MPSEQDFRILGPLEVVVNHQVVPIRAPKLRVLLGALLLQPNKTVGIDDLADRLWEDGPQRKVKAALHTYVWRLRGLLEDADGERVVTTSDGYQVRIESDELDLLRFRALSERARGIGDLAVRARVLEQALGLWRGPALEGMPSDLMRTMDAPRLEEERLDVLERRFDVELRLGRHGAVIGELQSVVDEHPLRERFHAQLMLALYRSGRQGDVFAAYRNLRTVLAEQLGVDPTDELQLLHQQVLTNDPAIAAPTAGTAPARDSRAPRELPTAIGDFVGREKIKTQMGALLTEESRSGVPLVVISGQPGVGKTALAVHVAHELRDRFPDGQLYADLRAHSSADTLTAAQLLPRFLISLGVPPQQVPLDVDESAALYRTLLADRKVLVLLDNVGTPQQVRPLLPNAPDCGVIVTSRNQLLGLTALQGAHPINLEVLTGDQAGELLATIIGPERVAAEADDARELALLCGHLPLALRIVAANLLGQPGRALADYAADLRQGNRLAALEIDGDEEAAVRAAFELSYAALEDRTARLFRLLGLVPGPDFGVRAAAALAGVGTGEAELLLEKLAAASLVNRKTGARYQFHDLLRLYAQERCHRTDDRQVARAAKERLLHHYLQHLTHAGGAVHTLLRLPKPTSTADLPPVESTDPAEAMAWLDVEALNVFASIVAASRDGFHELAWPMAEALRPYLATSGRYRAEGLAACAVALDTAVEHGALDAEGAIHTTIGAVHIRHTDSALAIHHFTSAIRAYRASGSTGGEVRSLIALGNAHHTVGHLGDAARNVQEGLRLAEVDGDRTLRRFAWLNVSLVELVRGNLARCELAGRKTLELCDDTVGDLLTRGEARTIFTKAVHWQGRCAEAVREFTTAIEVFRSCGAPLYEANATGHLSAALRERGELTAALDRARAALALARDCGAKRIETTALNMVASIHHAMGQHERALADHALAMAACDELDQEYGRICAFLGSAECHLALGDLATATTQARQALRSSTDAEYRMLEGRSMTTLARIELAGGHPAHAYASSAVDIARETGALLDEARALEVLGHAWHAAGDAPAAHEAWQRALACAARSETPVSTPLHQRLIALFRPSTPA